jgi:RNA polymerase sigma factor (sigma-70 family)
MTDRDLLQQYVQHGSEAAFTQLVSRYVKLVYSVCRRRLRDAHLAEDATQAVFLVLAKKARRLRGDTVLAGWLHRTARYAASNAARAATLRRQHEAQAAVQGRRRSVDPDHATALLEADVDAILDRLGTRDRHAIVLRVLEGRSFREVAEAMAITEDAAKKRVARGLDRLREFARAGGVASSAAAIERLLSGTSHVPPPELASAAARSALGASPPRAAALIAKETLRMFAIKNIVVAGAGLMALGLLGGGAAVVLSQTSPGKIYPAGGNPPAVRRLAAPATMEQRMARRLPEVNFDGVGLSDVADFMKDISGIPIAVDWNAVASIGITRNTPTTVVLRNANVSQSLDALVWTLAEPGKLSYVVRDDGITISTADALKLLPGEPAPPEAKVPAKNMPDLPAADALSKVIDQVQKTAALPVWVDWTVLKSVGVRQQTKVPADKLNGLPVAAALDRLVPDIGSKAPLAWTVRDGMIAISSETRIQKLRSLPAVQHHQSAKKA